MDYRRSGWYSNSPDSLGYATTNARSRSLIVQRFFASPQDTAGVVLIVFVVPGALNEPAKER
jgi:hypothetical protein